MVAIAEDVVVKLTAEIAGLQRGMDRGAAAVQGFEKKMATAASRVRSALVSIGVAFSVREYVQLADAWKGVRNQLLVSGVAAEQLEGKLNELFAVAQRHGTDIKGLSTLYGRLAQSADDLGASESEMMRFVDGVAIALRVQGGDAQTAAGALLQLSQALGSATVRAEEYNSINEGARPILQAVANGLDAAKGSVSNLRNLVIEGKVSSQEFFQAFLKGLPTISDMAEKAEGTVSQAWTRLQNSMTRLIGKIDEGSGASRELVTEMNALGKVLDDPSFGEVVTASLRGVVWVLRQAAEAAAFFNEQIVKFGQGPLGESFGAFNPNAPMQADDMLRKFNEQFKSKPAPAGKPAPVLDGGRGGGGNNNSEAARAAERYASVMSDLNFELEKLAMAEREAAYAQQLRNALTSAGVTLSSEEGAAIRDKVDELQRLTEVGEAQAAAWEVEAANVNRVLGEMHEKMAETAAEWAQIGETIENALGDAFVEMAANMENAREIVANLIADIGRLIAKALILKAIQMGVDSIFGGSVGGKALGGLVNPGNAYLVGESGPELIVPRVPSSVVPNNRLGGGSSVTIQSNIYAAPGVNKSELQMLLDQRDADIFRRLPAYIRERSMRGSLKLN